MVLKTTVPLAGHAADNNDLDPSRQQMWNLIGYGVTRSPTIHIEGMGEDQPAPTRRSASKRQWVGKASHTELSQTI